GVYTQQLASALLPSSLASFSIQSASSSNIWLEAGVQASSETAQNPFYAQPIAIYDFADGNLADDSSGNGNTLAGPLGGAANITTNPDGLSAHFDGSGGNGFASYF
ncbi:hypothetical protein P4B35_24255, partial [Pontiellaceae bacterium B12227]|nr:hypothetical protein [Pontiellaceae bacterium B12227]